MQHKANPDKPDAVYARKLQEVLGDQYGEITVAMQYAFQAWNMHIPGKYRDLVFGIGGEEFGHVEMLATMIARLLEKDPLGVTDDAVQDDPTVAAVIGGTAAGRFHRQRQRRNAGPAAGGEALQHDG